jgi:hypothetical protein
MGAKPGHVVSPETRAKISAALRHRDRTAVCEWCGRSFKARSDSRGRFCSRQCSGAWRSGNRAANFNGGLSFSGGRWTIYCRDGTSLHFARGVMAAEFGRLLTKHEIVHHRDSDPTNDDVVNLAVLSRSEHARLHHRDGTLTNIADWKG